MCSLNGVVMVTGSASSMEGLTSNDTAHHLPHLGEPTNESVIVLERNELDRANKDKRHYPETFEVTTTTINRSVVIFISIRDGTIQALRESMYHVQSITIPQCLQILGA